MGGISQLISHRPRTDSRRQSAPRGFSLVELLVVIGIIAVLISILLPTLSRARAQANSVQCKSNLRQIGIILQMYVNENKGWLFPVGPEVDGKPTTLGTNVPPNLRWPTCVDFDLTPPNPLPFNPNDYHSPGDIFNFDQYPTEPFTPKIMICPSDLEAMASHSYVLNKHLADKKIRAGSKNFGLLTSSEVIVAGEKKTEIADYYLEIGDFDRVAEKYRHGIKLGSNYLYHDGHVDIVLPDAAKTGLDPWDLTVPDSTSQPSS